VTKFKPEATATAAVPAAAKKPAAAPVTDDGSDLAHGALLDLEAAGFVRDERGLRFVGEAED
jgi:hypothetical protein